MNQNLHIFKSVHETVKALANDLIQMIDQKNKPDDKIHIALSGGSTPKALFDELALQQKESIDWKKVHLYWVDERCVPPNHPESNFGMTKTHLLDQISIPDANVHRIRGEDSPTREVIRYTGEILRHVNSKNNKPQFDVVILGLGNDGHTASIFPDQMELLYSEYICGIGIHPDSGQLRITLTGTTINSSKRVIFLVTGEGKARLVEELFKQELSASKYPAANIKPLLCQEKWYLDKAAASLLA